MPEYVIEREIPGAGNLSDEQLQEIARKSVGVLKDMGPGIKWLHSYVTGDKVYCVYFAPDEETIHEHGRWWPPGQSGIRGSSNDWSEHRRLTYAVLRRPSTWLRAKCLLHGFLHWHRPALRPCRQASAS